jgi:uncharacterized RDD family membrane protein YckC
MNLLYMTHLKTRPWSMMSALLCALLFPPSVPAQLAPPPVEDNEPGVTAPTNQAATDSVETQSATNETNPTGRRKKSGHGVRHDAIVSLGKPAELKAGDSSDAVVSIGGSIKVYGHADAVVAIFGDVEVDGGQVDDVVAILGQVRLTNQAKIHGDVVTIGAPIEKSEDSIIEGTSRPIDIGWFGGPNLQRIKSWFIHCVFKLRPLAFQVPWVWTVGGVIFLVYLLVGAVFPRPVLACVGELSRRPTTTLVLGGVSLVLLSLVFLILVATGFGLIIVPFLFAAVVFGVIVGKVAALEWLGLSIARQFGGEALAKPLVGLVFGGLIVMLLYLVPVLGLVTFGVITVWALGSAVTATFSGLRKEAPERPSRPKPPTSAPAPPPSAPASATPPAASAPASTVETPMAEPFPGTAGAPLATSSVPLPQPGVPDALAYPRAGFWERIGAGCLDIILVSVVAGFIHHPLPGFLLAVAYFVGMWTWKGTTIGGIVLALKVVRADSQPLSLTTALVRALAGVFSMMVCFLGILWIAWDSEKQGWHDRIAGTLVLRLPRGTPLVCL